MIMTKGNIDLRPILLKVGVAVALSFAGFLFTRFRGRKNNPSSPTGPPHSSDPDGETDSDDDPSETDNQGSSRVVRATVDDTLSSRGKDSGDKDWHLLPELNDLVREFDFSSSDTVESPKKDVGTQSSDVLQAFGTQEKEDYEKEAIYLRNMVRMLSEREQNLEVQLLKFHRLKEQESAMLELQNRLKVNNVEVKFLNLKIESLQADNRILQDQVADYRKVVAELDTAREKIRMLQKKLKFEAERNREQILTLQKKVMRLQEQEQEAANAQVNSERTKALENSESARQLDSTQVPANSIFEDPEIESLKVENHELAKQVERLQADRCADVEELVYLRWVNACLRYELRNFQPPHGKTAARDLSNSLSLKSEERVKQLIHEYAKTEGSEGKGITSSLEFRSCRWPSSQASYTSEFGDFDDSFLSPKGSGSSKVKFLRKLRRLIRGKDAGNHDNGSTLGAEDSECISTETNSTSDFQFGKAHTPSSNTPRRSPMHSTRYSLDIQQMTNMKIEGPKDMEFSPRSDNVRSSSERWLRIPSSSDFSEERQADQEQRTASDKSELAKFAAVLTHSDSKPQNSSGTANRHRKSASVGSFEPLRRHSRS